MDDIATKSHLNQRRNQLLKSTVQRSSSSFSRKGLCATFQPTTKNINQFVINLEMKHEIFRGKNRGKWPFSANKTLNNTTTV